MASELNVGSLVTTGIVKSDGSPTLSAAAAGEAIFATEGSSYGAILYGNGSLYDVVIGRRSTAVALGVTADTVNLVTGGDLKVTGNVSAGAVDPDVGTNAPTARTSVGKLNTYTGMTASIADAGTLDMPLTMPRGLMAYLIQSNTNTNHMSAGFFRANSGGASSAFTFFGQSETAQVAVTHPSAGNIRITNSTGGATTFFYAITVIAA